MNNLLRLVPLSDGARASARFNVHCGAALEMAGPLLIRALKRRERRAPPAANVHHPINRAHQRYDFTPTAKAGTGPTDVGELP